MATPSSSTPCAACKFLRRKCQAECVFAPYFPPDQPQKFANVHRVFGASNVTKLLNDLHPHQREDAVNSLAFEADMRLRDPVYGCVGLISLLQHQLRQIQFDLSYARSQLSKYHHRRSGGGGGGYSGGGGGAREDDHHHHHQYELYSTYQFHQLQGGAGGDMAMDTSGSSGGDRAGHQQEGGGGWGDECRSIDPF